ncbi:MAG: hypothetical protein AAGI34_08230 [Pseudomonadota bacterium]
MTQADIRLADLLDPVRDRAVGDLLQALAAALELPRTAVNVEPIARDARGRVRREGALALPQRADLALVEGGHTRLRRIESDRALAFEPLCLVAEGGFTTVVSPFRWEAATLRLEMPRAEPDWRPLRRWYLEWFQSRFADVAPDLEGAVHGLDGPHVNTQGYRFTVDFGSAPVAAFSALIEAVAETGCLRMVVGKDA